MRARDEQISHLSSAIFNQHDNIDECIALARKYILEAERRAEQRVRAKIARDSERLDWLSDGQRRLTVHDSIGVAVTTESGETYVKEDIRQAIDAAREAG